MAVSVSGRDATLELIDLADIDELVRYVDRLCDAGDWDEVDLVRVLSRKALERGRQLWPVAGRAEYRLALDGPPPLAAAMLVDGAGRFALGPLPEVAAATHTWSELAPHAPATAEASVAAFERVVRGEDLTEDGRVDQTIFELPLVLQPWEPTYPLAIYHADKAEFPLPAPAGLVEVVCPARAARASAADPAAVEALTGLARVWTTESNGRAEAVAVEGEARDALAAFGLRSAWLAEVTPAEALARMAWTAASGGAHGRRRGMAAGRFDAWWVACALVGLDDWPVEPGELGEALAELRWFVWSHPGTDLGWSLRLAVEDPADDLAWALVAADHTTLS